MTPAAPPPVTVGVPVFNGEQYLATSLKALQDQEFGDIEILIRDNASTDGTEEIARSFVASDDRFRYFRNQSNLGGAVNSNLLLRDARSPLFMWAYYDDLCRPSMVGRCVEVIDQAGPETVVAYPRVILINGEGVKTGEHGDADLDITSAQPHERVRLLLRRMVMQVQFGLMRTDVARAAGGASLSPAGEMALPLAMALRGRLALVPEQLLAIREHEERHGGDRTSEVAWVNPSKPRVVFPYSRSTPLFVGIIGRAPLPPAEKARCTGVLLWNWTRPGWRTIAGDIVRLPRDAGWVR